MQALCHTTNTSAFSTRRCYLIVRRDEKDAEEELRKIFSDPGFVLSKPYRMMSAPLGLLCAISWKSLRVIDTAATLLPDVFSKAPLRDALVFVLLSLLSTNDFSRERL